MRSGPFLFRGALVCAGSRPIGVIALAAGCRTRDVLFGASQSERVILMEGRALLEGATIEQVREFFRGDRFATVGCNPLIEEARPGHSKVSMHIEENHLNGLGSLMGGVSFTLADFAFAVASNVGQLPTVTVNVSVDFMGTPKDDTLVAVCEMEKSGRTLCFASVRVADGLGNPVSRLAFTGCRKAR